MNQPFAMFEPVEVDDTYQPETAEETENDDAVDAADITAMCDCYNYVIEYNKLANADDEDDITSLFDSMFDD